MERIVEVPQAGFDFSKAMEGVVISGAIGIGTFLLGKVFAPPAAAGCGAYKLVKYLRG